MLGPFLVVLPFLILEQARWQATMESAQRDWRLTGEWSRPQQRALTVMADVPPVD